MKNKQAIKKYLPTKKTATGWVSVKDSLPESDCNVLIVNNRGYMTHPVAAQYEKKFGIFYKYVDQEFYTLSATHWLKVPLRPQMDMSILED